MPKLSTDFNLDLKPTHLEIKQDDFDLEYPVLEDVQKESEDKKSEVSEENTCEHIYSSIPKTLIEPPTNFPEEILTSKDLVYSSKSKGHQQLMNVMKYYWKPEKKTERELPDQHIKGSKLTPRFFTKRLTTSSDFHTSSWGKRTVLKVRSLI